LPDILNVSVAGHGKRAASGDSERIHNQDVTMENPNPYNGYTYVDEEEVHLQDYINVLFRRRKSVVFAFCAIFLSVALYTFLVSPLFEAKATLHVRDEKVNGNGLFDDLGLSRENPIETEVEILRSRTNIEEVVKRLHLDWQIDKQSDEMDFAVREFASTAENPHYVVRLLDAGRYRVADADGNAVGIGQAGHLFSAGGLRLLIDNLRGHEGQEFELSLRPFNQVVLGLREAIKASEVGKGTNIIQVSYRHTDPELASEVVNALSSVYLERNILLKSEEANKSVEFIDKQLQSVRENLDTAEEQLAAYKSTSGVVEMGTEATSLIGLLTGQEKELASVELLRRQAQFAVASLKTAMAQKKSYVPAVLMDDPVVSSMAEKLATLEVEKRRLLVDLTEMHPDVRAVQGQIMQIQDKLLSTYQQLLSGLSKQSDTVRGDLQRYEARVRQLPAAERDLARLTRRSTVNAEIYTFLLQKHEEARLARAATIGNVNIIDPAIVPDRPVKPQKAKNLLLGLIVGCMAGIGLAFLLEYLDDSIKDGELAKREVGVPLLSVIPYIGLDRKGKDRQALVDGNSSRRVLIAQFKPKSAAAEAFRSLRTSLHFSSLGRDKKVLLVTSAFPSEGKTTISGNLAVTLAQTGNRVLLVGCDLRKPTLQEMFGDHHAVGLTEVLVGDAKVEEAIKPTGLFQLDFLPSGAVPPNPAELLESQRMKNLVRELRDQYDVILLDAPPVLAVTDATILTSLAEQVVWVLQVGGVSIKAARRVKEIMDNIKAPLIGFVLNDKNQEGQGYYGGYSRYGSYGRYGYGYGYGYGYYQQDKMTAKPGVVGRLLGRWTGKEG
jgi:tyrosine-protein kinase Etk/Wzc